ncbi:MAG: helix-turn-helix domain-containing protein [Dehalococcoidia bacterium]|nr:helix-turn-helix domain-containing protein [Dehalococcoidia bacterium]
MKLLGELLKERNIILEAPNPVTAEGFTQVPNFILRSPTLSVGGKLTYAMFLSYAWHNDLCFPGQEKLAEAIGVSRQSVGTFIRELEREELVRVKRRGLGKTNLYTIRFRAQRKPARRSRLMSKFLTS